MQNRDELNAQLLVAAAQLDKFEEAKDLLAKGASPNAVNEGGDTCLHITAEVNNLPLLNLLLGHKLAIAEKNKDGLTAMQVAAKKKHWFFVIKMANAKSELFVGSGCYGDALFSAVMYNQDAAVDALLKANAMLSWRGCLTQDGCLHLAVINNNPEILQKLIKHGAKTNKKNKTHQTPFDTAIIKKHWECAEILALNAKQKTLLQDKLYEAACSLQGNDGSQAAALFCKHANDSDKAKIENLVHLSFAPALVWMGEYHGRQYNKVTSKLEKKGHQRNMQYYYEKAAALGDPDGKAYLAAFHDSFPVEHIGAILNSTRCPIISNDVEEKHDLGLIQRIKIGAPKEGQSVVPFSILPPPPPSSKGKQLIAPEAQEKTSAFKRK